MSSGLLILWKEDSLEVISSFKEDGFLGIKVLWKEYYYYIINVYSSCALNKKIDMWAKLLDLKENFNDGEWIIGGDYNAIKHQRKGSSYNVNANEINPFADFIVKSNLVDISCKGEKISWYNGDGLSMSRIDRFLVSDNIVNRWGVVGQLISQRDISDHCPIWLVMDNNNWGPKPFKFTNEWFSYNSFIPFVEKEWNEIKVEGRGDFVLKEKLKLLKSRLKWWNKVVFGKIYLEVEEKVREINYGDDCLEDILDGNHSDLLLNRKEETRSFWLNLRIKENISAQRSKVKWLKEGDCNSGYFHKVLKERRIHNHIGPISSSGSIIESVAEVKEEVQSHFANKFVEVDRVRIGLEGSFLNQISKEERLALEFPFLEDEIKEAIWNCGCMYKAIAKLLAGRLKKVLHSVVSSCQSAFVPGRQLLDGVLVANEVVDFAKKGGRNCLLFKVDFEKAYDKVN
ncbi:uncharacterized protein LOC131651507 [Vicia villosa]|uniref:uncharacterized protein LOC131651507 n=1 Tax=Vicia villosa TaxID=3911 RepID=UPI00273B53BE|nr:uncharacterized protein LOC131651507 [Vicia villosa]